MPNLSTLQYEQKLIARPGQRNYFKYHNNQKFFGPKEYIYLGLSCSKGGAIRIKCEFIGKERQQVTKFHDHKEEEENIAELLIKYREENIDHTSNFKKTISASKNFPSHNKSLV